MSIRRLVALTMVGALCWAACGYVLARALSR